MVHPKIVYAVILLLNDSTRQRLDDCFRFRMDGKFFIDMLDVGTDRVDADEVLVCNHFVAQALYESGKNVLLAWGKLGMDDNEGRDRSRVAAVQCCLPIFLGSPKYNRWQT